MSADSAKELASIRASVEKINEELGFVKDRLTRVEENLKWIRWLVFLELAILLGLLGLNFPHLGF